MITVTLLEHKQPFLLTMARIQDANHVSSDAGDISGLHNNKTEAISARVDLAHEMRFLFRIMGVVGLYHTPKGWRDHNSSTLSNFLHLLHKFYCILTQLMVWFNAIRRLVGVFVGDEVTMAQTEFTALKFVISLFFTQAAINSSIFFYICSCGHLSKCINFWQMCCQTSRSDDNNLTNISLSRTWFRRRMWTITAIICLAFLVCSLATNSVDEFSSSGEVRNDTSFYAPLSGTNSLFWKTAVDVISSVYTAPSYCFPLIILTIFGFIFLRQYELLTQSFVSTMASQGDIKQCLHSFRKRHQQLCKSVGLADKSFSFYLATLTCSSMCIICFTLFQLVIKNSTSGIHIMTPTISWMTFVTIMYASVVLLAALVHENVSIDTNRPFYSLLFFIQSSKPTSHEGSVKIKDNKRIKLILMYQLR